MSRIGHTTVDRHIFGSPPLRCPCCDKPEQQTGCVRGFPCTCTWDYCYVCHKCTEHCACPGGPERDIRSAHAILLARLQKDGKVHEKQEAGNG